MKPTVIPAILERSFDAIADAVHQVADVASCVQIDVADGVHVPAVTWPYTGGMPLPREVSRLDNLAVPYELDLMVHRPEETLRDVWLKTAAVRCIVHLTGTASPERCVAEIKDAGKEAYIAVVIGDNLSLLEPVIRDIDGVQCMGIATVGRQGEPYDERVYDLIAAVRRIHPTVPISVDGGVSAHTVPGLIELGVSHLAVGSAVFRGDAERNFLELRRIVTGR